MVCLHRGGPESPAVLSLTNPMLTNGDETNVIPELWKQMRMSDSPTSSFVPNSDEITFFVGKTRCDRKPRLNVTFSPT